MNNLLTIAVLSGAVNLVISFFLSYVPGANTWFAGLTKETKQLSMLVVALLVSAFFVASSCAGWWIFTTCDKTGIMLVAELLAGWAVGLGGSQGAFMASPQLRRVRAAKEKAKAEA